ncbi:MAG TPA: hypothetical protein VMS09_18305 [Paenibacillus sp.]|uniref:hypothetical protein n=1 Tax=Paenibacillus sp. TaxID=58172 RepID=UPI0028D4D984|nr:hypothetical protein [Paenibacillus sp.]HUC93938.1 hypothetical protein [Paenibacillus sp.]
MGAELRVEHCPSCGKLYQKNLRSVCGECAALIDGQFTAVDRYLARNRSVGNEQLAEATGVPVKTIQAFIRQKRISLSACPNLADACDSCGGPSRQGHLCLHCSTRLKTDIRDMLEKERKAKESARSAMSYKAKV